MNWFERLHHRHHTSYLSTLTTDKMHMLVGMLAVMFVLHSPARGQVHLKNDKTRNLNNGDRLLLWCNDNNVNTPPKISSLVWSKDGVYIPQGDPRLNTVANGTLEIQQVRQNDAGVYNCTINAPAFLSVSITRLSVFGIDPTTRVTSGSPSSAVTLPTDGSQLSTQAALNNISVLQQKVADLTTGNFTTDLSSFIRALVKLTEPANDNKLTANELLSSLDVLVRLVNFNSETNNSAINSTTDQYNVVQAASNLLEEENTDAWLQLQEARDNVTDDLLKSMDDFGSQLISQLKGQKNSTTLVTLTKNIGLRVDRLISRQTLQIDFSQYGAEISLPAEAFSSETQASTIAYKTLNNILSLRKENTEDGDENGSKRLKSASSVISATVFPRPRSPMMKPIKLVFNHTKKNSDVIGKCVFWEIGLPERTWLTRGCVRVDHESNARVTTCECDHLTIFAVLMSNKPVEEHHDSILQYISTIGCAVSLFFILLTFTVMAVYWRRLKSPRVTLLLHLCTAIAASCILIIITGYVQWDEVECLVNAALLHYFLLCVFTWMLCHGGIFYFLIIKVELRDKMKPKMKWFYAFGWGFPFLVVAVSLAVTGTEHYVADNCWLTMENSLIYWAFVAPVAIVILINTILFIFLLARISKVSKFRESMTRAQHVKAWLRRSIVLLPVLGVTWSFGLLTFISSTVVFHYLFTICNSLQGFVIFFNFCIIDSEVRAMIVNTMCRQRYPTSLNASEKPVQSNGVPVPITSNVHGKQSQEFYDMVQKTAGPNMHQPKIQTWMRNEYL